MDGPERLGEQEHRPGLETLVPEWVRAFLVSDHPEEVPVFNFFWEANRHQLRDIESALAAPAKPGVPRPALALVPPGSEQAVSPQVFFAVFATVAGAKRADGDRDALGAIVDAAVEEYVESDTVRERLRGFLRTQVARLTAYEDSGP